MRAGMRAGTRARMMTSGRWTSIAMLLLLGLACNEPEGEVVPVHWLDYEVFVSEVQPILGDRCGNPSCHGRPERAFAIYSPLNWRADPAMTHVPEALTEDELYRNYAISCVFVTGPDETPDEALLLGKSLGDSGGGYHGGGVVFESTSDREYRVLRQWIEGQ